MIAEADRSRCAIMIALDVMLALRPLRPLGRCLARLAVAALLRAGLTRRGMLRPRLLRPAVALAAALARSLLARLAMLMRLIAGLDALDARGLHRLGLPLAVLARLAVAIGAPWCAVAAEPAAASFATAGALGRRTASAASAPTLARH